MASITALSEAVFSGSSVWRAGMAWAFRVTCKAQWGGILAFDGTGATRGRLPARPHAYL